MVLSGNKRLRALKLIYGDESSIPIEWTEDITSMTTEQRRIYLIAANVVEGEWDVALMRELYSEAELALLIGEEALDSLMTVVDGSAADASASGGSHDDEMVELAITLSAENYRRAYVALVSRNENISKALMEAIDELAA